MAELNSRGLLLGKDRIIYNIPHGTLRLTKPADTAKTSSDDFSSANKSTTSAKKKSSSSSPSLNSAKLSNISSFREEPAKCSKEFYVGNPGENAKLKISTLKDGIRCDLSDLLRSLQWSEVADMRQTARSVKNESSMK
ncbi:hypothetical protein ANCCAN_29191 [Ancylostoma caninum]|uniref:Uncharacterized protein n=1 Tax=Ancylostoma caninum TaxID=29170 RepID=A0A368F252_ANCCA|nr:hypothetical protein ANCCAN_29191 [Ancylostoma caninum]